MSGIRIVALSAMVASRSATSSDARLFEYPRLRALAPATGRPTIFLAPIRLPGMDALAGPIPPAPRTMLVNAARFTEIVARERSRPDMHQGLAASHQGWSTRSPTRRPHPTFRPASPVLSRPDPLAAFA